jgi:MFS family permease
MPRTKSLVLFVVSAAIVFDALDLSITQIALPSIGADLDIGEGGLPWIANAYVLTYGGLLLLGGRMADLVGRRRTFVLGLSLFGAMSLACGLAPGAPVLVVARALQGVGAALTVPAAVSLIATTFAEGQERNRALGVFGACASAGFAAGLVLGGLVTDALSWRWIFLVKVPVVLAVALLAIRVVAADPPRPARRSYDLAGAGSSALGLLALVFVITQLADRSVAPALVAALAMAAVVLLVGFVRREGRVADPLLPLDFFALRTPRTADLASLTVLAAPFGFSFLATLFLQRVQHHSALETGLRTASRRRAVRGRLALRGACAGQPTRLARERRGWAAGGHGGLRDAPAHGPGGHLHRDDAAREHRVPRPRDGHRLPRLHRGGGDRRPRRPSRSRRGRPEHGPAGRGRLRSRRRQRRCCRRWERHG